MASARSSCLPAITRLVGAVSVFALAFVADPAERHEALAQSAAPERTPAKLSIAAPVGASLHVDGTFVGTAPLEAPIDVEPGRRLVTVAMNGFHARSSRVSVAAGKPARLSFDLDMTDQRVAAWALIGAGTAGISTAIAFGVVSVIEHREARDIQRRSDQVAISPADERAYDGAIASRDDYRVGSGIAAGVGLAALLVGGALYVLDGPDVPTRPGASDAGGAPLPVESRRAETPVIHLLALPIVEPRFTGAAITVRF